MENFQEKIEKYHKVEKHIRLISITVAIIPIIVGTFWVYFSYQKVQQYSEKADRIKVNLNALLFDYDVLTEKKKNLEKELMNNYGLSIDSIKILSTSKILEISLQANDVIKKLSYNYQPAKNIIVRYYNKTIDQERVVLSLKALGYNFESKIPTENMKVQNTNAIWYGSGVALKDIKIVALTLIRAGVEIKAIRSYQASLTNPSYKSNIIEVGGDKNITNRKTLSVEDVENARDFPRDQ